MADGQFDAALRRRIEAFQRDHGLVVDGELGAKSWGALVRLSYREPEPTENTQTAPATQTMLATDVSSATESSATAAPRSAVTDERATAVPELTPERFPLLYTLTTQCVTEEGLRRFLLDELGVDLLTIEKSIREVLS